MWESRWSIASHKNRNGVTWIAKRLHASRSLIRSKFSRYRRGPVTQTKSLIWRETSFRAYNLWIVSIDSGVIEIKMNCAFPEMAASCLYRPGKFILVLYHPSQDPSCRISRVTRVRMGSNSLTIAKNWWRKIKGFKICSHQIQLWIINSRKQRIKRKR